MFIQKINNIIFVNIFELRTPLITVKKEQRNTLHDIFYLYDLKRNLRTSILPRTKRA